MATEYHVISAGGLQLAVSAEVADTSLIYSENFDDQTVTLPFRSREYGAWDITPPAHSWGDPGRGGGGYSYGSGTTHDVYVSIEGQGSFGHDEIYISYWIKYPSYVYEDTYWNAKFFYLQQKDGSGAGWEIVQSQPSTGVLFYDIRDDAGVSQSSGGATISDAWDGNWHHYEYYVKRSTGNYKFTYEDSIKINVTLGQIWDSDSYDISFCSIDASGNNVFTRFIDDLEVRNGEP